MNNLFETIVVLTNSTMKMLSLPIKSNNGTNNKKIINVHNGDEIDAKNLASDWNRVGNDMRRAIVKYDRKLAGQN